MWMQVDNIYDLIINVLLCHIHHVTNDDICRTKHITCGCKRNEDHLESFRH